MKVEIEGVEGTVMNWPETNDVGVYPACGVVRYVPDDVCVYPNREEGCVNGFESSGV